MANHWYSEEMKVFHESHKGPHYYVYHWFYKGKSQGWNPSNLEWGYVGIAPYQSIQQRYKIELKECVMGARPRKRKVIQMLEKYWPQEKIGFKIVGCNLTRNEALKIEGSLRTKDQVVSVDRRIWNEKAGG